MFRSTQRGARGNAWRILKQIRTIRNNEWTRMRPASPPQSRLWISCGWRKKKAARCAALKRMKTNAYRISQPGGSCNWLRDPDQDRDDRSPDFYQLVARMCHLVAGFALERLCELRHVGGRCNRADLGRRVRVDVQQQFR